MELSEAVAVGIPALVTLMVLAAVVRAWRRRDAPLRLGYRAVIVSLLHLLLAATVYWNLAKAGWLTATYHWDDPDDFNLVLAIFEALCALAVIAFAVMRNTFLEKLLYGLLIIQLIIAATLLALLSLLFLTWKPRIM
jgi:hypothetical protein